MFAICNLSIVPVRAEASDKSELITQILFGETVQVIDKKESWRKVKLLHDDCIGWVDVKQITQLTDEECQAVQTQPKTITFDIVQLVVYEQHHIIPIVLGSTLPFYDSKNFHFAGMEYSYDGSVKTLTRPDRSQLLENAYMYLNAPYLWGGRSPFGVDCSGFTQMVYKMSGFPIRRDAWQQAEQGVTMNLLEEALPGDLAFFDNAEGRITHVGILLPGNRIIHASGRVRIDKMDHHGIFNETQQKYTHKLRVIKRHDFG